MKKKKLYDDIMLYYNIIYAGLEEGIDFDPDCDNPDEAGISKRWNMYGEGDKDSQTLNDNEVIELRPEDYPIGTEVIIIIPTILKDNKEIGCEKYVSDEELKITYEIQKNKEKYIDSSLGDLNEQRTPNNYFSF